MTVQLVPIQSFGISCLILLVSAFAVYSVFMICTFIYFQMQVLREEYLYWRNSMKTLLTHVETLSRLTRRLDTLSGSNKTVQSDPVDLSFLFPLIPLVIPLIMAAIDNLTTHIATVAPTIAPVIATIIPSIKDTLKTGFMPFCAAGENKSTQYTNLNKKSLSPQQIRDMFEPSQVHSENNEVSMEDLMKLATNTLNSVNNTSPPWTTVHPAPAPTPSRAQSAFSNNSRQTLDMLQQIDRNTQGLNHELSDVNTKTNRPRSARTQSQQKPETFDDLAEKMLSGSPLLPNTNSTDDDSTDDDSVNNKL